MRLPDYLRDRNRWLLLNFIIYLGLIFGFAYVYYHIFISNPQNFAFNSDIVATKNTEVREIINREADTLSKEQEALNQLFEALSNRTEPVKVEPDMAWDKATFNTPNYQFVFELSPHWTTTDNRNLLKRNLLDIMDNHGNQIAREEVFIIGPVDNTPNNRPPEIQEWINSMITPVKVEVYQEMISPLINKVTSTLNIKKASLDSVKAKNQDYWSFWDFFYFSAITQTTVGYGDILPNSTLVRIVVVIQVLSGLLMLGISINVVFGKTPQWGCKSRSLQPDYEIGRQKPFTVNRSSLHVMCAPTATFEICHFFLHW